jgi:hypothetical protein
MARKRIKKKKKKGEEIGVVLIKINLIILCHKASLRNFLLVKNYTPPPPKKKKKKIPRRTI